MLPPGTEDLALRALSCLLTHDYMRWLCKRVKRFLGGFLSGKSTLAEAALRHAAWWHEVNYLTLSCPRIQSPIYIPVDMEPLVRSVPALTDSETVMFMKHWRPFQQHGSRPFVQDAQIASPAQMLSPDVFSSSFLRLIRPQAGVTCEQVSPAAGF